MGRPRAPGANLYLKFLCEKTLSAIGTEEFKKEKEKEIKIPFVKELLNFKKIYYYLRGGGLPKILSRPTSASPNASLSQIFRKKST